MTAAQLRRRAENLRERYLLAPEELELTDPTERRALTYDVEPRAQLTFIMSDTGPWPEDVYLDAYDGDACVTLPLGREAAQRLYGLAVVTS